MGNLIDVLKDALIGKPIRVCLYLYYETNKRGDDIIKHSIYDNTTISNISLCENSWADVIIHLANGYSLLFDLTDSLDDIWHITEEYIFD